MKIAILSLLTLASLHAQSSITPYLCYSQGQIIPCAQGIVFTGPNLPTVFDGKNGDLYLYRPPLGNPAIFGPKANDAWPATGTSLVGPQGLTGQQGAAGAIGAPGPQGPAGATGPAGPSGTGSGATGVPCAVPTSGVNVYAQLADGTCLKVIVVPAPNQTAMNQNGGDGDPFWDALARGYLNMFPYRFAWAQFGNPLKLLQHGESGLLIGPEISAPFVNVIATSDKSLGIAANVDAWRSASNPPQ